MRSRKLTSVIKGKKGQQLNQRDINLINSGAVEGVLQIDVNEKHNSVVLTYSRGGLVGLREFLQMNEMSKRLFVVLLRNVVVALKSVESNKLSRDLIIWDLSTSYVDPASWHVYLTYVPIQSYETTGTLKTFLQQIVSACNFALGEDVQYVQQLVEALNSDITYTVNKLEDYCNNLSDQLAASASRKKVVPLCPRCAAKLLPQELNCPYCGEKVGKRTNKIFSDTSNRTVQNEKSIDLNRHNPNETYFNGGHISVNEDENGVITVFRGSKKTTQVPWLEDHERSGKIIITKFPFRIGKMEGVTDYRIFNNNVSRKHADIIKEQGRYYIIDLASTNGTYLDGRRIQPGVKEPLNDGTMLKLADAKFKFHID